METINRNDFIEVYVLKTLNEIKSSVKQKIKLNPEQEKQTDEKMKQVLKDLINANFKNLQMNPKGDLLYTFLPIIDEKENEKVRLSLMLYYTALYFDNVDLLHDLLKENINFGKSYNTSLEYLARLQYLDSSFSSKLQYLDSSISSKFDRKDYINKIKTIGYMFLNFATSIEQLPDKEKEIYIKRFVEIINSKYEDICSAIKDNKRYSSEPLKNLFTKDNLDIFSDDTYKHANAKQLKLINYCNGQTYNKETIIRLNNLIKNTDFSNCLCDFDLMMSIYTDEELFDINNDISYCLAKLSNTEEMLQKAIDFVNLRPDLACYIPSCVSKEKFMITSNYVLIEAMDYIFKHEWIRNSESVEYLSKILVPKVTLKKMFGAYKKRDS